MTSCAPSAACYGWARTSAILDRVLHHAETVIIEGKSFRMKDEIDE
jgi:hypothetical protein